MMAHIVTAAWMLSTALFYIGMGLAFCGVAVFGRHFIRANGRAAQEQIGNDAAIAWGGAEGLFGLKIVAAGAALHLFGYFLGMALSALA